MHALIRLLLAIAVASGVPGVVVYFALAFLSSNAGQVAAALLLAPLFLAPAIVIGDTMSILPATGLGLSLMAASRVWGAARSWLTWTAAGLVCGFFLVSNISAALNPFADLKGACVAAICGASSMLVFWRIVEPYRLPQPVIPARSATSVVLGLAACALVGAAISNAYSQRHTFAVPDQFRFSRPAGYPETATLFSYNEPKQQRQVSTWKTNGRSITLRTGQPAANRRQVVESTAIRFTSGEIRSLGVDPIEFKRSDTSRADVDPGIHVRVKIDQDGEQREIIRLWGQLTEQPLSNGEHIAADGHCAIAWKWNGRQVPEAISRVPGNGYVDTSIGAAMTNSPLEATRFECSLRICMVSFPFRNVVARFWIEPSEACNWRRQRAAIKNGLNKRLVAITSDGQMKVPERLLR